MINSKLWPDWNLVSLPVKRIKFSWDVAFDNSLYEFLCLKVIYIFFKIFGYFGEVNIISQWPMKIVVHVDKANSASTKN